MSSKYPGLFWFPTAEGPLCELLLAKPAVRKTGFSLWGTTQRAKELESHLEKRLGEKWQASLRFLVLPYWDTNDIGSLCLEFLRGLALCSVIPVTHMIISQAFKLGQQALFV